MFDYTLTSDELENLRGKYPPGLRIAITTTASHNRSLLGTVLWVNDEGAIIVNWDDEETPKMIISKNVIKSIPDPKN